MSFDILPLGDNNNNIPKNLKLVLFTYKHLAVVVYNILTCQKKCFYTYNNILKVNYFSTMPMLRNDFQVKRVSYIMVYTIELLLFCGI